jgi:hypothetical protein
MTLTASLRRSPAVKRAVQTVTRTGGLLTNRWRMTPGFLIVGTGRSGTTSLYRTLAQHPAILKPVRHKGVHYFDVNYDRGMAWYRAHFPLERTAAAVERRTGVRPLTFESSPYYSFHPLAADRIAADLPDVKVIVLLRDPVERAYSAWSHELARGFEDVRDFATVVELEESRLAGEAERMIADPHYISHAHMHQANLTRGRYIEHLERLEKIFGRDRMHVVDSHRFFGDPEPVYDRILEFLELPNLGYPTFEQHNARSRSPMDPALRERLQEQFAPFDERLVAWLGEPVSWRDAAGRPVQPDA